MKKSIFIKLLLCMLSICLLSACKRALPEDEAAFTGSGAVTASEMIPEEGASLLFWTADKEYGEAIAKAFEEKYGVEVTTAQEGMGVIDKIALSGPAGEGPDVFMIAHDNFNKGLSAGIFMELEEAVALDVKEKVSEVGVNTVISEEKMYGVPVSIEVNCLYYNKDLVETPATTLEEIIEGAKTFNEPENNKFYLLSTIGDGYTEYPFLSSGGFQLFGENGDNADNPGFDTQEYERGLELISSLQDIMPISSTDLNNKSSVKSTFMGGTVAYYISGPWDAAQIKESGMNYGITILPTYEGNQLTPFAGVQCAHVSNYTQYPIAAQLFADFLISEEGASILYKEYDGITTLKNVENVEGLSEDEYMMPFVAQFEYSIPMPSISRVSYYWSISQDINRAVFDGQLTPVEGRTKSIENWNALLATE